MEFMILDTNFNAIGLVDKYESMIWTDRYRAYGDFEIYTDLQKDLFKAAVQGLYVWSRHSDRIMIIEDRLIDTKEEIGTRVTVTGRSLESILTRRIVWEQTNIRGNLQNGIKKILNENVINPKDPKRKIENIIFKDSTDPEITKLKIDSQYTGTNVYDLIVDLCETHDIGFRITLNETNQMVFELYKGVDRTYDQTEHPYVIFSPKFDNLIASNYYETKRGSRNVALVGGEGEGLERRYISIGDSSGLDRREIFVDARDITSEVMSDDPEEGKVEMPEEEYLELLESRGQVKMSEFPEIVTFEGSVVPNGVFQYGRDFYLGDYVQLRNEYGMETKARVDELVRAHDLDGGVTTIPGFTSINEEDYT